MLAYRLPTIPLNGQLRSLKLECLQLAYLAYYNNVALSTRVQESYRRAFGLEFFEQIPRVENLCPGAIITHTGNTGEQRLTAAIEGTTAIAQLLHMRNSVSVTPSTGHPGLVYATFAEYASELYAKLRSNETFEYVLTQTSWPLIFTGHSMGAAIAQILAYIVKHFFPTRTVKYMKFGSPKVCTQAVTGTQLDDQLRLGSMRHIYDPIGDLPIFTPLLANLQTGGFMLGGARVVWEAAEDMGHDWVQSRLDLGVRIIRQGLTEIGYLTQAPDELNPFTYHLMNYYRQRALEMANEHGRTLLARLRYLEHPGENGFGHYWASGSYLNAPQLTYHAELDADFDPQLPATVRAPENFPIVATPPRAEPRMWNRISRVTNQMQSSAPPSRRRR